MRSNESGIASRGEQDFPGLYYQGFRFGKQGIVRCRRDLDSRELPRNANLRQMKSQKLEDVMRTFDERFEIQLSVFEEIADCALEGRVQMMCQLAVDDADDFVILLHAQDHLADPIYLLAERPFLVFSDRLDDQLGIFAECAFQLMQEDQQFYCEGGVGSAVADEVGQVGLGFEVQTDKHAQIDYTYVFVEP